MNLSGAAMFPISISGYAIPWPWHYPYLPIISFHSQDVTFAAQYLFPRRWSIAMKHVETNLSFLIFLWFPVLTGPKSADNRDSFVVGQQILANK